MAQPQKQQSFLAPDDDRTRDLPRVTRPAEAFSDAIRHPEGWRASPARQMQEQLAAWAAQHGQAGAAKAADAGDLPVAARLAIVGVISAGLWAAILSIVGLILPIW